MTDKEKIEQLESIVKDKSRTVNICIIGFIIIIITDAIIKLI